MSSDGRVEPGWYPDPWSKRRPYRRASGADRPGDLRWWNGTGWTETVAPGRGEEFEPLPLRAGAIVVAVLFVSLIASRILIDLLLTFDWPIVVFVAIGATVGYGPPLVVALVVGRRAGCSRLWFAGRWRMSDLGWGPVVWLSCVVGQVVVALVVVATGIPFTGNIEDLDSGELPRDYLISVLVIGVLVAPIVEELLFRGVVLRSLVGTMGHSPAVVLQGILFGAAHVDPMRGVGNVGLVLVLSTVGMVLGGATLMLRRVWPAMIAHGILNAVALALALTSFG